MLDKSLKFQIELCVCLVSVSLSCVMAGSGDLECLRTLRELRWKVDDVTYGSHMMLSMAIGMLFLSGGTSSLKRDPFSIACIVMSICPRYSSRTIDNQYHSQPLRHLYVLACEHRALQTIDVDSGLPVCLEVEVLLKDGGKVTMTAPGLLPELSTVAMVRLKDNSDQKEPEQEDISFFQNETSNAFSKSSMSTTNYYPTSVSIQIDENGSYFLPPLLVKKLPLCHTSAHEEVQGLSTLSLNTAPLLSVPSTSTTSSILSRSRQWKVDTLIENMVNASCNYTEESRQDTNQNLDLALMQCDPFVSIIMSSLH